MKKMKRKLMTALMVGFAVLSLAACGAKPFTCDFCGEEKTGKSYKSAEGDSVICESCYKELQELFN